MKYLWRLTPWVVVTVAALMAWREFRDADAAYRTARADAEAKGALVTLWQSKYVDASMQARRVDTLWRHARARVDSVRVPVGVPDTLSPGTVRVDSSQLARFVEAHEEAMAVCDSMAQGTRTLMFVADSAIAAERARGDAWQRAAEVRRPRFRDRVGVTLGYGAVVQGGQVRAGPTVGVTVRVWP